MARRLRAGPAPSARRTGASPSITNAPRVLPGRFPDLVAGAVRLLPGSEPKGDKFIRTLGI